jgi:hypothetical protein
MNQMRLVEGIRFLEQAGLNLAAVLDCAELSEATAQIMAQAGVPLSAYWRLTLVGRGGQAWGMKTTDTAVS